MRFSSGNEQGSRGAFHTISPVRWPTKLPEPEQVAFAKANIHPTPHYILTIQTENGPVRLDTWELVNEVQNYWTNTYRNPIDDLSSSTSFRSIGEKGMGIASPPGFPVPARGDLPAWIEYMRRGGDKHTAAAIKEAAKGGRDTWWSNGLGAAVAAVGDIAGSIFAGVPGLGTIATGAAEGVVEGIATGELGKAWDAAKKGSGAFGYDLEKELHGLITGGGK